MMYLRTRGDFLESKLALPANYTPLTIKKALQDLYGQGEVVSWPSKSSTEYGVYLCDDGKSIRTSKIFYLADSWIAFRAIFLT